MDYIAYLHKDSKSDFGVSFPDFPGCVTAGKSLDEARRKAPEALAFHIAGMLEDGEKIPKPSKMDDLAGDPNRENRRAGMTRSAYMVQSATSGVAFKKRDGSGRRIINTRAKRVKSTKRKER